MLIKFYDALDAEEFFKMFNGCPFDTLDSSHACELVYVTGVSASAANTLPQTYPLLSKTEPWPIIGSLDVERDPSLEALQPYREGSGLRSDAYELPFCPVCLDRLDSRLSGLVTGLCQHTFHCECLQKWDDSRCPVCRYSCFQTVYSSQASSESANTSDNSSTCSLCETHTHLWVCLICANVGCGRYEHGHARQHYEETGHLYCLEVETQRVWDYAGDGYVHRLIQSKTGGKLVELPSASDAAALTPERLWNASYPGAMEPTNHASEHNIAGRSIYQEQENAVDDMDLLRQKMEALGTEYSNMIISQLDSQRVFYESQIKTLKANQVSKEEYMQVCNERDTISKSCLRLEEEVHSLHAELEIVNSQYSRQEVQLKRAIETLSKTKKELVDEKSVSDGLYKHVRQLQGDQSKLQNEVADLQEQLRDVMFFVSAREKIEKSSDTLGMAGGDVMVPEKSKSNKSRSSRKR